VADAVEKVRGVLSVRNNRLIRINFLNRTCELMSNLESMLPSATGCARPKSLSHASSPSFCIACGSTGPCSTGRRRRLPCKEITGSRDNAGRDVPAGTMAVVRSLDAWRAPERATALSTLIRQRHLTPSCGGHAPTAERTVGPARMLAESLTPTPGIREQHRPQAVIHQTEVPHCSET